jgi:hypothetical protein
MRGTQRLVGINWEQSTIAKKTCGRMQWRREQAGKEGYASVHQAGSRDFLLTQELVVSVE